MRSNLYVGRVDNMWYYPDDIEIPWLTKISVIDADGVEWATAQSSWGEIHVHVLDLDEVNFRWEKLDSEVVMWSRVVDRKLAALELAEAERIATKYHDGQFRRDKVTPYINHPREVSEVADTHDVKLLGWLHDTIEDSPELRKEISGEILNALPDYILTSVEAITKVKSDEYDSYIQGVMNDPLARKAKLADIYVNYNDSPTDRQMLKYEKAVDIITGDGEGRICNNSGCEGVYEVNMDGCVCRTSNPPCHVCEGSQFICSACELTEKETINFD